MRFDVVYCVARSPAVTISPTRARVRRFYIFFFFFFHILVFIRRPRVITAVILLRIRSSRNACIIIFYETRGRIVIFIALRTSCTTRQSRVPSCEPTRRDRRCCKVLPSTIILSQPRRCALGRQQQSTTSGPMLSACGMQTTTVYAVPGITQ